MNTYFITHYNGNEQGAMLVNATSLEDALIMAGVSIEDVDTVFEVSTLIDHSNVTVYVDDDQGNLCQVERTIQ